MGFKLFKDPLDQERDYTLPGSDVVFTIRRMGYEPYQSSLRKRARPMLAAGKKIGKDLKDIEPDDLAKLSDEDFELIMDQTASGAELLVARVQNLRDENGNPISWDNGATSELFAQHQFLRGWVVSHAAELEREYQGYVDRVLGNSEPSSPETLGGDGTLSLESESTDETAFGESLSS